LAGEAEELGPRPQEPEEEEISEDEWLALLPPSGKERERPDIQPLAPGQVAKRAGGPEEGAERPCTVAFISSRMFLPGLMTLAASYRRHNPDDRCNWAFLWHSTLPDTNLSANQRASLETLAGPRMVRFLQVDGQRASLFLSVPTRSAMGHAALLKLELFWAFGPKHTVVYLDTDMLVTGPLDKMWEDLNSAAPGPWTIHGSSPWHKRTLNTGFFVFTTPVPAEVTSGIKERCEFYTREGHVPGTGGDQDIVNDATGQYRNIHTDWYTNFRPGGQAEIPKWRIVHWCGSGKPWKVPGAFNNKQHAGKELDDMWQKECHELEQQFMNMYCEMPSP